jgi:hypothetical protein
MLGMNVKKRYSRDAGNTTPQPRVRPLCTRDYSRKRPQHSHGPV